MADRVRVFYNSLGTPQMYELIRSRLYAGMELVTLSADDDTERVRCISDCDVAIVAATPLRAPIIEAGRKLRLIHHQGVGYHDTVDVAAARQRGIRLALTPEGTTIGVAEHTLLLALGAARRAAFADAELRQGRWHVNALRPVSVELYNKSVGLIGFGRIGQETAIRMRSFGTRCYFYDPAIDNRAELAADPKPFDWIIENCDVITLHLPLTERSRHLISRDVIARMKPEAILINTARGGIVDDLALAEALAEERLLAAGLDVFEDEPIGAGHVFCGLPNVFLTPHISAGTRDAMAHKMDALFANVDRFRRNQPLANEIDLHRLDPGLKASTGALV